MTGGRYPDRAGEEEHPATQIARAQRLASVACDRLDDEQTRDELRKAIARLDAAREGLAEPDREADAGLLTGGERA